MVLQGVSIWVCLVAQSVTVCLQSLNICRMDYNFAELPIQNIQGEYSAAVNACSKTQSLKRDWTDRGGVEYCILRRYFVKIPIEAE